MAGVMLQAFPSFYAKYSEKSIFVSATKYEQYLVCKEYCVAEHNDATCFSKNCKYHLLLVADKDVKLLMEKLDTFCFTYQFVDCFYTLFKYRFSGPKMEMCLIWCKEQSILTDPARQWIGCRVLQKRDCCAKKLESIFGAPPKRQFQPKLVDRSLQREFNKLKRLNLSWI